MAKLDLSELGETAAELRNYIESSLYALAMTFVIIIDDLDLSQAASLYAALLAESTTRDEKTLLTLTGLNFT